MTDKREPDPSTPNKATPPEAQSQNSGAAGEGSAAELAELKDRLLRALAEQENFRRRAERERDEAVKFAAAAVVQDLLATADNLARALASVPPGLAAQDETMQNLVAGVAATERALLDAFLRHGIAKVEPVPGESFDPERHQALFEVAGSVHPPGSVAEVILPGYTYHQRLLRPALVGVAGSKQPSVTD